MNKISTISLKNDFKKLEKKFSLVARKILKILKKENISVDIYLADNKLMRALNKKMRGKDKVANVLSFEYPNEFIGIPLDRRITRNERRITQKIKPIGEVYLNVEMDNKIFPKEFLLAHGILHLLGYDHVTEEEGEKMSKKEKMIISKI